MAHAIRKAKTLIVQSESIKKAKSLITTKPEIINRPYRSKLMVCIEILCTLVSNGPMKLTQLTPRVELDKARLIPHLKLLRNRGLIEKQNLGENKIYYAITDRGLKVLKVVSPIIREAHKIQMRNFEIISNTLSDAGIS